MGIYQLIGSLKLNLHLFYLLESLLSYLILATIPFVTVLLTEKISQLEQWKGSIVLISTFASFGLTTMTAIQDVSASNLSFNEFYVVMGIFSIILVGFGLLYRKGVKANFKKVYDALLVSYTYIFFASALSMHWMSPFFQITV